jgi:hypothetical protein
VLRFLVPIAVILILAVFIVWKFATRKNKYERSREEVSDLLSAFLEQNDPWAWDTFLSFPLKDEQLEAIRIRCAGLAEEFPPQFKGRLCGDKGLEVIRTYIKELRK